MADAAADPKAAPLSEELRQYALTFSIELLPKNFSCERCKNICFDPWKLLCCNKSICSSCQSELTNACPLCQHEPLEADGCVVNKGLRQTMRAWFTNRKKKDAKIAASEPVSTPQASEAADKPVESIEEAPKAQAAAGIQPTLAGDNDGQEAQRGASSAPRPSIETSTAPHGDHAQRQGSSMSQTVVQSTEPTSSVEDPSVALGSMEGTADGIAGNTAMFGMNGGQASIMGGFGFNQTQGNFNPMGWNGMNSMNGMSNMMGTGNWNASNPMDMYNSMNMNNTSMPGMPNLTSGMYGGYGGNMGMPGMNDMSTMNMMGFGGGYGNGWQGQMNSAGYGNFDGFNSMGGYNQSGAQYPQMMSQYPNNNYQNQNRSHAQGGAFPNQKNYGRGNQGSFGNQTSGPGRGFQQNSHSRPGSRAGPADNNASELSDRNAETPSEVKGEEADAKADAETAAGKVDEGGSHESAPSTTLADVAPSTDGAEQITDLNSADNDVPNSDAQAMGLNPIQTVETVEEAIPETYDQEITNAMQPNQSYPAGMMNDYANQALTMDGQYGSSIGYNQTSYVSRGGYNTAYGAATVLTGEPTEPRGLGVEGAPTGPRAMREGLPNTGYSSRANNARSKYNVHSQPPGAPQAQSVDASNSSERGERIKTPAGGDDAQVKDISPSRPQSEAERENRDDYREASASSDRYQKRKNHDQPASRTPEDDYGRRKERRHHRSSRYDEQDDRVEHARDGEYEEKCRDDRDDRYHDDREDRDDASVDSKHRSRREKEKSRQSRSHRDRSREHRRRHRSRSRSPFVDEKYEDEDAYGNGGAIPTESSTRRKSKSEKHRERDRSRDRDRDKRDRRDREYDREYEYEREKDRVKDKDRDRKRSRRDRSAEAEEERAYEDKHRSSRRSRKDKEREKDREYDRERERESKDTIPAVRAASPPIDAPTGPAADQGFSIRGRSKTKHTPIDTSMPPPPSAPRAFKPPTGPAADRDRGDRGSNARDQGRRRSSASIPTPTTPVTPTTPTEVNHYAQERERKDRERLAREHGLHGRSSTSTTSAATHGQVPSRPSLSSKRSRDDLEEPLDSTSNTNKDRNGNDQDIAINPPTGPSAHREKRRKSGMQDGAKGISDMFTKGMRRQAAGGGGGRRRGGVKTEGEAKADMERAERERERRW
ncbi:uncharacterized protein BDR25DRAFT_345954 [Lindgomyces ingoldianus]|uniref:Uncharacterized protein n=1 Tax=Lindgomyces ingoldianus TaxID=673940 RepID=A0ACB6QGU8_9PLEO|nr:uncharacterized protein BDR25DRAFT_345954 [Lindgomyces ingoldianus]KAF2465788.1 hypothetical protein BDR25DRAFT_345954 [Lindgomyces ingoldianus]